ncbi:MAG: DNA-directed DNA polymerase II small subunit [Thermoplasmata archaeon]
MNDRESIVKYLIREGKIPDPESIEQVRKEWNGEKDENEIKVLSEDPENFIGGNPLENFKKLFADRFTNIKSIITRKAGYAGVMDINYILNTDGEVRFVGIVDNVHETKYGFAIEFEDLSGSITGYCSRDFKTLPIKDDIVGVTGNFRAEKKTLQVRSIDYPNIDNYSKKEKVLDADTVIAMISDIHVGSKMFLEEKWNKLIEWINSNKDTPSKLKYILIAGDVVDGVGIYPDQNYDLLILDIYEQYQKLSEYLKKIPENIKIVIIPGNHDIVRVAEPQPSLPKEVQSMFSENIMFLPNPAYISIEGLKILMYHGGSLNDIAELIPGMKYNVADRMMMELIKRRHLAPVYGNKVPIVPMSKDLMVIKEIPDLFITGHIHTYSANVFNGIEIVNASTWQAQTNYQKMLNFNPDPGKVAIKQLNKLGISTIEF